MHPTARTLASRVHTPLIRFLGRRKWPAEPEPAHPHPTAPPEYKDPDAFSSFQKKIDESARKDWSSFAQTQKSVTTSKDSSKPRPGVYEHIWEAPSRVWKPRVRYVSEEEMDAVISGGATTY